MCMAAEWGLFGVQRCGVLGCVSPSPPAPLPRWGNAVKHFEKQKD